jgi:hypothetical protein
MRTRSGRRSGWAAAVALAVAALAPEAAEAQQTGLFPLAPIRRERPPCPAEDPVYRLYRHEYFGYHPTCWRRYPAGWGCPSPEAPDEKKAFEELKRTTPPTDDAATNPEGDMPPRDGQQDMPPRDGGRDRPNNIPPLPPAGSNPFDLDTPSGRSAGGATNPAAPPGGNNPPPVVNPPGADNSAPGTAGPGAAVLPPVTEPMNAPGTLEQPVLSLPEPTASVPPPPSALSTPAPYAGPTIPPQPPVVNAANVNSAGPFQAPRRTSFIGSLFNGGLFRR